MNLFENRWWAYDDAVVKNKHKNTPTLELCGAFDRLAEVNDPIITYHLSIDFLQPVEAIQDNCLENDLFKSGRR